MISQLERLNSNETKIAPRWVWIAVNGSDLSAKAFMVSSKMDGSDPHFDVETIATHNTSWDLELMKAPPGSIGGSASIPPGSNVRCSAAPLSLSAAVTSGRAADRGARTSRVLLSGHSWCWTWH